MLDQQNFSQPLVAWFQAERAHVLVPARGASDPYAIWIAEIMLQQTQVSTVWPYYQKWMDIFPTVADLARASQDQVLKLWEGLGYYSRARNLHKAAGFIVEEFKGKLPSTAEALIKIPGIGPYTSAAIASLAFDEAVPLIDGNVLRVLSRVEMVSAEITKNKTKAKIHTQLASLISQKHPGAFNQSLMDLGRVICTPKNPDCKSCPIADVCQAYRVGRMEDFPVKAKKAATPHYTIVIGLIRRNGQVLIQKRPAKGLLGGLWEFPGGKVEQGETPEAAVLREIGEETGLDVDLGESIGTIQHAYSHFKITLSAWFCDWTRGEAERHAATSNRWVSLNDLEQYAFPRANLKILELLKR